MKKEGFPKSLRIKRKKEWEEVMRKGVRVFGQNLILLRLETQEENIKFGIGVSSGLKGAVKRNRVKRILREVIRKNKEKFFPGERVILIYRSKEKAIRYNEILTEFLDLVKLKQKSDE
ncbi:MAG: ribonuclease P protein component [Candidatus Zixiibacteriota bacterium]